MRKYILTGTFVLHVLLLLTSQTAYSMRNFQASYYQTSSLDKASNFPLPIYKEPDIKSKTVGDIAITENFSVERSQWVQVVSADGKTKGWARDEDIQKHVDSAWSQSYVVQFDGDNHKYTVKKISPAQQKIRYEKAAKNARRMWDRQRRLLEEVLIGPMYDVDENDESDESTTENAQLKAQIDSLNKKMAAIEKKQK